MAKTSMNSGNYKEEFVYVKFFYCLHTNTQSTWLFRSCLTRSEYNLKANCSNADSVATILLPLI